jgi:hypothetical protein
MNDNEFGTVDDYSKALEVLIAKGLPDKHIAMLKFHCSAPQHTVTWAELAQGVGYPDFRTVNLQYGTLAHRVAENLGINEPPNDFWLFVLVDWTTDVETESGHQAFTLRRPVVDALQELGVSSKEWNA